MAYFMRFFVTDEPVTLDMLEGALKAVDPAYSIATDIPPNDIGELMYRETVYGQITITRPDDIIFEEEIDEFKEALEGDSDEQTLRVLRVLDSAKEMISLEVVSPDDETLDGLLERIDPLWDWLFEHRQGLLQADDEGFYDANGFILEIG